MKRHSILALGLAVLLILGLGVSQTLAGKGGKKPPPDEPPPDPAIAFVVSSGGNGELTVTNEDGSNLTVLLSAADGASEPWDPTWSPDGSALAFRFDDGTNGNGIYTLEVVVDGDSVYGANLTQILSASVSSDASRFSWSPVPVFGKYRIAFSMANHLYMVNADGTGELTDLDKKATGNISWSPTGDRLATTPAHGSLKIHHLEQDEPGGPIYVGYSPRYDVYDGAELMSVWSLEWAKTQDHVLAVSVAYSTGREDLWIVDLRDGVLDPDAPPEHIDVFVLDTYIALTNTSNTGEVHPTWSSDDLALLFVMEGGRNSGSLYVFDDLSGTGDPSVFYRSKKKGAWRPEWRR